MKAHSHKATTLKKKSNQIHSSSISCTCWMILYSVHNIFRPLSLISTTSSVQNWHLPRVLRASLTFGWHWWSLPSKPFTWRLTNWALKMENLQKTRAVVVVVDDDVDVDAVDGSSHPNNKQSVGEEHIGSSSESGSCSEIVKERSSVSVVDLECGAPEIKLHLAKVERDCRICHLTMDAGNLESRVPFELGCSCKDDLAAAHKQCAEAWFKIKGNK